MELELNRNCMIIDGTGAHLKKKQINDGTNASATAIIVIILALMRNSTIDDETGVNPEQYD